MALEREILGMVAEETLAIMAPIERKILGIAAAKIDPQWKHMHHHNRARPTGSWTIKKGVSRKHSSMGL
jgi:hypothetical protein